MHIVYGAVITESGDVLVSEFSSSSSSVLSSEQRKDMSEKVRQVSASVRDENRTKVTYKHNTFQYHCKVGGNGSGYFAVALSDTPMRVCYAFLGDIELEHSQHGDKGLKKLVKEKLSYYNDPANDRITSLKSEIDDVKDVMMSNIDAIISRGEKLDDIQFKADNLQADAEMMGKRATQVKNKMIVDNILLIIILIIIIISVIVVVIIIAIIIIIALYFMLS